MADPNNRRVERTPVTLKIKFKSETLDQFIERYAVDVSPGGIFIRTKEPLTVGTPMKFEFQLRDATPLIAGEGTVVWTRENDPSRPAVAPGMGVRFDRLVDGSQGVIDKILVEKSKQPQRAGSVTAKPFTDMPTRVVALPAGTPLSGSPQAISGARPFTDMPTRVAPLPTREALIGGDTPTVPARRTSPTATPFQTDAGSFAAEAFEEATKVRTLDELVAATAAANQLGRAEPDRTGTSPFTPAVSVNEELANPSHENSPSGLVEDLDSVPILPSPPTHDGQNRFGVEIESSAERRFPRGRPSTAPRPEASPLGGPVARSTTSSGELAAEQAPAPPQKRSSRTPTAIAALVLATCAVAVWYFVLRGDTKSPAGPAVPETTAVPHVDPGLGAAPTPDPPTPAETADVEVTSNAPKSMVTVVDSTPPSQGATKTPEKVVHAGPAPLTARLEKDKSYLIRVEAPGHMKSETVVVGGQDRVAATLVAKPHVLMVSSEPSGAQILINNSPTGKVTPSEIELTASHRAKPRLHVQLHKAGFRWVDRIVEITGQFTEQDAKMSLNISVPLVVSNTERNAEKPDGKVEPRGNGSPEPKHSSEERAPEPPPVNTTPEAAQP